MRSLIPWRRHNGGLATIEDQMENMFQRFFGTPFGLPAEVAREKALQPWEPRVDIEETEKELYVKADLPGVDPKDVEVTVAEGALVIKGEKKEEKEEKSKNFHRVERFVGQFYREIVLPTGVDCEKIVATNSKGVLTVTIPKKPNALPKKIAIKGEV
jgi:HSP20 family protein